MSTTVDDLSRYNQLIWSVAERLGSFDIDPDTTLWHYTTGNGLLGSLKSSSLYATQVSCLNDSMEVRYSAKLFVDALRRLRTAHINESKEAYFIDTAMELFQEDPETPNHVRLPYFVTCFSTLRDDLSQWRAYGGGENGYAIAFKAQDLEGIRNTILARVAYFEKESHEPIADEVAQGGLRFFLEGFEKSQRSLEDWTTYFLSVWDTCITQIAPMVKDAGSTAKGSGAW